jgi:hypothetical protein
MDDQSILHRIQHLVDEEHRLDNQQGHSPEDRERHHALRVELDQCWDLLRQRRARREFGDDPDGAKVRGEKTVEGYEQ